MSISEKLVTIAENQEKVYKAGQSSMVDESKIIEKTVSGEYISVDDVSEIPHEVNVQLTSGGKNLWKHGDITITTYTYNKYVTLLAGKTYTFSALVTSSDTDYDTCLVYDGGNDKFLGYLKRDVRSSITFTPTIDVKTLNIYASIGMAQSQGDTATFKDIMIEEGDTATDYEPYKETLTDYSGVSLTRCGNNLWKSPELRTVQGVTLSRVDDYYVLNGTCTASFNFEGASYFVPSGTYTLSCNNPQNSGISYNIIQVYCENTTSWLQIMDNVNFGEHSIVLQEGMYRCRIRCQAGITYDNYIIKPMLNFGSTALPYEPYNGQTLTANADGTVEGVTSQSPYMYMTTDNSNVTINATYRKSYGMQTEYDRFWDSYQEYGEKTDYTSAFGNIGWIDKLFNPKYPIGSPSKYSQLFRFSHITKINQDLDLTKMTNGTLVFNSCTKLIKIQKIITNENVTYTNWFDYCNDLENITFEGTIGKSISFYHSPKLSKASILNIFSVLLSTVTGQTLTLSTTAVNNAFETESGLADGSTSTEWTNLVATKTNWTISLV